MSEEIKPCSQLERERLLMTAQCLLSDIATGLGPDDPDLETNMFDILCATMTLFIARTTHPKDWTTGAKIVFKIVNESLEASYKAKKERDKL